MLRDGGCGCRAELRSESGWSCVLSLSSDSFLVEHGYPNRAFAKMEFDHEIANYAECSFVVCSTEGHGEWGQGVEVIGARELAEFLRAESR